MHDRVGGDEIGVSSRVGTARAAAVPVGTLEAGDLMRETPREKKARYAEPAEQTPDQKAEEIVKTTPGSNLEKTMLGDLIRVVSKFSKVTNKLIRTREKYQSLVQQVQQVQRENESNHQRRLTTNLERSNDLNLKARGER